MTVSPSLTSGNSYKYKVLVNAASVTAGQACASGWSTWDGSSDITAESGKTITIVEVDSNSNAVKAGHATVVAKA